MSIIEPYKNSTDNYINIQIDIVFTAFSRSGGKFFLKYMKNCLTILTIIFCKV